MLPVLQNPINGMTSLGQMLAPHALNVNVAIDNFGEMLLVIITKD